METESIPEKKILQIINDVLDFLYRRKDDKYLPDRVILEHLNEKLDTDQIKILVKRMVAEDLLIEEKTDFGLFNFIRISNTGINLMVQNGSYLIYIKKGK